MTPEQADAAKQLRTTLKAEKYLVGVEEEEHGNRVFVHFQKHYPGAFVGWYTILPDGRREFGRR